MIKTNGGKGVPYKKVNLVFSSISFVFYTFQEKQSADADGGHGSPIKK